MLVAVDGMSLAGRSMDQVVRNIEGDPEGCNPAGQSLRHAAAWSTDPVLLTFQRRTGGGGGGGGYSSEGKMRAVLLQRPGIDSELLQARLLETPPRRPAAGPPLVAGAGAIEAACSPSWLYDLGPAPAMVVAVAHRSVCLSVCVLVCVCVAKSVGRGRATRPSHHDTWPSQPWPSPRLAESTTAPG